MKEIRNFVMEEKFEFRFIDNKLDNVTFFDSELNELKKKHVADTHDYIDCYELPMIMKERYKL